MIAIKTIRLVWSLSLYCFSHFKARLAETEMATSRQLESKLEELIGEDEKYAIINEAKKRAIHSAHSYEEFKNLVKGALLKPMNAQKNASVVQPKLSMDMLKRRTFRPMGWNMNTNIQSSSSSSSSAPPSTPTTMSTTDCSSAAEPSSQ